MAEKEFEYEYNPVKELKGGAEAAKVVWSTKSLQLAVDALSKGLPLKANPFCGTNTKLIKPDLVYKRTKEEIEDLMKCMEDPVYFANKCYMMTPEGLTQVKMRDYQVEYLNQLKDNRFSILLAARQSGKCLYGLTKIKLLMNQKLSKLKNKYYYDELNNYIEIPIFELYNLYCKQTFIWKIKYSIYNILYTSKCKNFSPLISLLSIIDNIQYRSSINKIVDEINIEDNLEIYTDTGLKPISNIYLTKPFIQYNIKLDNGYYITCADTHILFNESMHEIFAKDLKIGDKLITDKGISEVIYISIKNTPVCMFDVTVLDDNHRFWSNGILSHNSTTTGIFCLWKILFHPDTNGLVLSKSGPAGKDLIKKIKDMYLYLPYHLKVGTLKWNQSSCSFDNNSSISTEAFSPTAGLGQTINMLILDEFAWCPANEVELFYENVIPTVTTMPNSTIAVMSTQNGFNLFYKLWKNAIEKKSVYKPYKIDWWDVPQYNLETKQWEKRTEEWHQMMVGILGSEESFQYQYGTQFSASDKCLVSKPALRKIQDRVVLFEKTQNDDLWFFEDFYVHPEIEDIDFFKKNNFIITVDIAEGCGSDYTVFNIFKIDFGEHNKEYFNQVAFWRANNKVIERSSLAFWIILQILFNKENYIISIEWNTYGALFYKYIMDFNEQSNNPEYAYRFNYGTEIESTSFCWYKKGNSDEDIAGLKLFKNNKSIPGIRWSGESKKTGCTMTKMLLESEEILLNDLVQVGELENFEDISGNGSYKASFGHDDMMMTVIQIPMLKQTAKYKQFIEDIKELLVINQNSNYGQNLYIQEMTW